MALWALLGPGCGGDSPPKAATTTTIVEVTSTTEPPLSREEYVRQGDALCADLENKLDAIPHPAEDASDEELARFNQQTESVIRRFVDAFKALKAPPADKATADQLNAYADNIVVKEGQATAAAGTGDDAVADRADAESEAAWDQFTRLARTYGFVKCSEEVESTEPAG